MLDLLVSTHSRLKAAGLLASHSAIRAFSFNTQPPEGGWNIAETAMFAVISFNTQPPEGGWQILQRVQIWARLFQHTAA